MTLEDDLRNQRAEWGARYAGWEKRRVPDNVRDCGVYSPGVTITAVLPPRAPRPHVKTENVFEKMMWERYGIRVQTQQSNYRPGTAKLRSFYEDL